MAEAEEALIGYTITGFRYHDHGEHSWPRFTAEKDGEEILIEISRDDEGNGPGVVWFGESSRRGSFLWDDEEDESDDD